MNEYLIRALLIIAIILAYGMFWICRWRKDADRRRQAAKKALEATRRNEADRRRHWVAREAMEEARRLKHARRHRRTPGKN